MGYLIEKKSIINYKIRIYGLIYILASINTFLDSLISAGILSKTDVGNRIIKAQKHIDAIKEIIMNE
jgi:hypothetical protein